MSQILYLSENHLWQENMTVYMNIPRKIKMYAKHNVFDKFRPFEYS